jgi:hypothetical protein
MVAGWSLGGFVGSVERPPLNVCLLNANHSCMNLYMNFAGKFEQKSSRNHLRSGEMMNSYTDSKGNPNGTHAGCVMCGR